MFDPLPMASPFFACEALVARSISCHRASCRRSRQSKAAAVVLSVLISDGSEDLGVMQINMLWLDLLARHTYLPRETVRERMLEIPIPK